MKQQEPINTAHLFPILDSHLIDLLRSLSSTDWERQTIASQWKVKDIAAHLLDGNIRSLSMLRDQYYGEKPEGLNSYGDLVDFLNVLNADWTKAMRRVSPMMLTELLEITGRQYCDFMASLKPFEKSVLPVAWAGEKVSYNWFHVAREYTEKWHHQQQIRLAVGKEALLYSTQLYQPYLETSMRALPYHFSKMKAEEYQLIEVQILGDGGGHWYLYHNQGNWDLLYEYEGEPTCEIEIPGEIAWRIFTKGIPREDAAKRVTITGNKACGDHILSMLAVMA